MSLNIGDGPKVGRR